MTYRDDEAFAQQLDAADPLKGCREWFHIPSARAAVVGGPANNGAALDPGVDPDGPSVYLTGNSLGCMPKAARQAVEQELRDWETLGVEGHIHGRHPWLPYHEFSRETASRLVGAKPSEVVIMNSLTVNLHLLMVSFYRPTRERFKIVIEDTCFPSDSYAVGSQADFHARHVGGAGFDPKEAVIRLKPRPGEHTLRTEDICDTLRREGKSIALVMLGGVNYLTGQWFDMPAITRVGHEVGAIVGWDLAHGAGNVPVKLHDWDIDFAAWCSYKYVNGGPGALAGAFVHEKHSADKTLPQFAGWWGNDPGTRFKMGQDFTPVSSADRWQLSNPPILSLTPVMVSLGLFDKVGMTALREKSLQLTGYLEWLIDQANQRAGLVGGKPAIEIITPRDPNQRGCALSLIMNRGPRESFAALKRGGVICDFREPNVIRAAPVPLYTSFHDVWRAGKVLAKTAMG